MRLQNKTAIITGASSGIGEATAVALAREGARLVLAARRVDRLEQLKNRLEQETGARVLALPCDVTKREDVERVAREARNAFGTIDILVNNAGVMLLSYLKNDKVDEWERMVDVNIKGVLYAIHAVLPGMLAQKSGHIVNISSVAGHEVFPAGSVYSATKYAVRALTMTMEKELSRTGVRVTNISPGAVDTELATHITDEAVLETHRRRPPDFRKLAAQDIANAIVYALTQPDYVNVNEIIVRPQQPVQM
jgi:hypothetical protein